MRANLGDLLDEISGGAVSPEIWGSGALDLRRRRSADDALIELEARLRLAEEVPMRYTLGSKFRSGCARSEQSPAAAPVVKATAFPMSAMGCIAAVVVRCVDVSYGSAGVTRLT
jgi:hypothetical protein